MKAMVLAAGFGTRLGPLTATTPKCLMDIGGQTMLEHVVAQLVKAGVSSIVINTHYLAEQLKSFVRQLNNFGIEVTFSDEAEILGTGGGVRQALAHFEQQSDFIIHNADIYSEIDLRALVEAHRQANAAATLAVMDRPTSRYLVFDEHSCLIGWENPKDAQSKMVRTVAHPKRLAFSGISVASPPLYPYLLRESGQFSLVRAWINAAAADERVLGHRVDGDYWVDIGTPKQLEELRGYRKAS